MMEGTQVVTQGKRERNISQKKLAVVESASFDTLIAAITRKSEKAQVTFLHRLFEELGGEALAMAQKYSESEIRKRARVAVSEDIGHNQ